jgi:uncharacterized protein YcbK (DUF882 family)
MPPQASRHPLDRTPLSRRALLRAAALGGASLLAPALARGARGAPRVLAFESLHTGEALRVVYREGGAYLPGALARIGVELRDHRTGDVHPIDPGLLDLLYDVQQQLGSRAPYQVISGYRSPATNAMLRAAGHGVVRRSFHVLGMAIDVRLPDVKTSALRDAGRALARGGVGYYAESDFVHLDVGPVRTW